MKFGTAGQVRKVYDWGLGSWTAFRPCFFWNLATAPPLARLDAAVGEPENLALIPGFPLLAADFPGDFSFGFLERTSMGRVVHGFTSSGRLLPLPLCPDTSQLRWSRNFLFPRYIRWHIV